MRLADGTLQLAATDLANFLACPHRTALDLAEAHGRLLPASRGFDAATRLLRQRGEAHECAYVEHLRVQGLHIVAIPRDIPQSTRVRRTIEALRAGVDVVYQGVFAGHGWVGNADILRKTRCAVGQRTAFGDFGYEPYDTKLAREARGGTVLQLAVYADLLTALQGVAPSRFFVVTPGDPFHEKEYRLADYAAYARSIRARLLQMVGGGVDAASVASYPEPVELCDYCGWWVRCDERRRTDDHMSFIAGTRRSQRVELVAQGVTTLGAAAALQRPVPFHPSRGARETYTRIVEQADVQLQQRTRGAPVHVVLPVRSGEGLCRLPAPSPGDLFLDLEGARFVREGGHEYLFGLGRVDAGGRFAYESWWAHNAEEEQCGFERLVDRIAAARATDPDLHVYHFAPYEPTALKRLSGRYATRQEALTELLRAESFVDLYTVVRQAIRAGVESYSIKELEQYYAFTRTVALHDAGVQRIAVELALEARSPDTLTPETRALVEAYNRDDVESTWRLRDWLEELRSAQIASGIDVPRPTVQPKEAEKAKARALAASALREKLLVGVPSDAEDDAHPAHVRWLLAYLIDWHHREDNAEWWEFFRLRDLPEPDLFDETKAIAGLQHAEVIGPFLSSAGKQTGSILHRYRFPVQEVELCEDDTLRGQDEGVFGELVELDRQGGTLVVKKGRKATGYEPTAVFSFDTVVTWTVQQSVMRFAERLHASDHQEVSAGADLLYGRPPRLRADVFAPRVHETTNAFALRIVDGLERTTLPIQGPPGSGKTYLGAQMIVAAVAAGKRVGVTANSHKVIQNIFGAVQQEAARAGRLVRLGRKPKPGEDVPDWVATYGSPAEAAGAVLGGEVDVLGGTAFLWADEHLTGLVDLLFVDEAGQFSLANVLAVAPAADSVILLGDPQQLDQPQKASHPAGVGVSALAHVLGEHETMPADRGIFLPETWRLAPEVCRFTSELFYAGELHSEASMATQRIVGPGALEGAGVWWVPVRHHGNRSASNEEVEVVCALVERLVGGRWIDCHGVEQAITPADIRVVAPYNAQVNRLNAKLPHGVEAGTVDKFQGQTCVAVIYSMATSHPEDAPRGMEFLYSLNRLNVATSRGRCAAFIVGSPALLEPNCRTPRQMQLANALCRFVEMANVMSEK